jgi:uncharacterized membrane protein (UPF0127 family)
VHRCLLLIAILGCSSSAKHDDVSPPPAVHDGSSVAPSPAAAPAAPVAKMPKVYLQTPQGDATVAVEVVATEATVERGLMFRQHLPPDQGMLFLMGEERAWAFWMRNTLIPLDMIFIAKDMTIAGIVENAEPRTETLREVKAPSLYVLEVNGGYCAAHKVVAGAKVRFDGVPGH